MLIEYRIVVVDVDVDVDVDGDVALNDMTFRIRAAYLCCCVLWGSTWMFIKFGLRDLPPLLFAGVRMLLAAAVLLPFAARTGLRGYGKRALGWMVLVGVLQIGSPTPCSSPASNGSLRPWPRSSSPPFPSGWRWWPAFSSGINRSRRGSSPQPCWASQEWRCCNFRPCAARPSRPSPPWAAR